MKTTKPRSPGLPRFIPKAKLFADLYGNFTPTLRDYSILELIHRYRYIEARHIRALVAGSSQQVTRRLQGLFHNGYIRRYAPRHRMRPDLNPGAPLMAYGLELRGARALAGCPPQASVAGRTPAELVRWKKDYTRRTEWFLEHRLMISNFRCVLELALRETPGVELVRWEQGQEIWIKATIPGSPRRTVRVAPDARFTIREAGQLRHFFLEMDRSTEEHRRLLQKYLGYWWYLQSPHFHQAHPDSRRVNVLFVTTGHQRMLNMAETLRQMPRPNRATHGGKGLYWFGSELGYGLEKPRSILDPIWRNLARSGIALVAVAESAR
jgi:hypothetical protein